MSSLNNVMANNFFNNVSGANQIQNGNATTNHNHQDLLLKNANNALLAANTSCNTAMNTKDSLLQHMATSFMANNNNNNLNSLNINQVVPFPSDVFERRNSLDAASAIAQATSIATSTPLPGVSAAAVPNNTMSSLNNLNAAATASALTSSMLHGFSTAATNTTTTSTSTSNTEQQQQQQQVDLFEPVPLDSAAAGQPDNALARMLSQALDEITSGFDSDPLADYNSLYNMEFPSFPQQQQQQQQQVLSQNAFLQATTATNSNNNNNKRSMPTATATSNKRARTTATAATELPEDSDCKSPRFRPYQEKQWVEQFEELLKFKQEHGHCLVPHTFEENPTLSRWVKRQRYQYKLKAESKQSTMTDARIVRLEKVGFVWDSHAAAWQERLQELTTYQQEHGDCNVPSNYAKNPQLATWVKCQRRQCKLFWCGKPSNMTLDRFASLNSLGFTWELRNGSISKKMMAAAAAQANLSL